MIGSFDLSSPESSIIYLIDFGVSQRYIDLIGNHLPKKVSQFRGNLIYASASALFPNRKYSQ